MVDSWPRWLLAGWLVVALAGCGQRPTAEPIWIGHLAPLSGSNREVGEQARQALQLSLGEALAGDKKIAGHPVAVLHVDSRNDDETVRAETVRLLTVNKVSALIGSLDAALAERMVREAEAFGVPAVVTGEIMGARDTDGTLALGVSSRWRGQVLARLVLEQKRTDLAVARDWRWRWPTSLPAPSSTRPASSRASRCANPPSTGPRTRPSGWRS